MFRTLSPMRKPYPTDLCDGEWTRLRSYLPAPKAQGRPHNHSLRDVLDAIFDVSNAAVPFSGLIRNRPLNKKDYERIWYRQAKPSSSWLRSALC